VALEPPLVETFAAWRALTNDERAALVDAYRHRPRTAQLWEVQR
jgi:hypothetical protein